MANSMLKEDILFKFGIRLDDLMRQKETTNEILGKELGCTAQMISFYRRGQNLPSVEKLCVMADYFDVEIGYLLSRETKIALSELINIEYLEKKLGAVVTTEYRDISNKSVMFMRFSINDVISNPSLYPRQDPEHVSIVNSLNLLGSTRNETIDSYYTVNGNIYRIPPNSDINKEVSQKSEYLQYEHIDESVYKYVIERNSLDPFRETYLKERRRLGIIGRLSPNKFYTLNFLFGYYEAEIKSKM